MAVGVGAAFATLRTREMSASDVDEPHLGLTVTAVSGLRIKCLCLPGRDALACS
jgi:hypothetical protein